jgi:hypothetical protein
MVRIFRAGQFSGLAVVKPQHKPRAAIRGSVSTPIPRGWITLDRLLAEAGIGKDTLNNLRQRYRYVIPRSLVVPPPVGRGGAAFYPPETVTIIRRLQEIREETRTGTEDMLWWLWLEGHRVDFRGWAADRLDALKAKFDEIVADGYVPGNALREAAVGVINLSGGRMRNTEQTAARVRDLIDWSLSAAAGEPNAAHDLEDGGGARVFDTLRKVGGLPVSAAFPPPEAGLIELLSTQRLAEVVAEATDEETEQARRDCQSITRLFAAIASVDWNATRTVVEPNVTRVTGAKPEPQSWQARKAQRTRTLPPPAIVRHLSDMWRSYNFRALIFAYSIGARRLPGYSKHITDLLALTEAALSLFPREVRKISPSLPTRTRS